MDDSKELRLLIADLINGLIVSEQRVANLTASLMALRATLGEIGADFEARYAKHYVGPDVQQAMQSLQNERDLLLAIAQRLRNQA